MTVADLETTYGRYSHDLLLHDNDEDLVAATRAFVTDGLASGGQVLVHGSEERVDLLRDAVGTHERLTYGHDRDLYQSPSATLFGYQRQLESIHEPTAVWATGTVPFGDTPAGRAAWARYESLANEALAGYAFHGLCTYDTSVLSDDVIAAARTTHPYTWTAAGRRPTPEYVDPAVFLAGTVAPPAGQPVVTTVREAFDLAPARRVLHGAAAGTELPLDVVGGLVLAANEAMSNGLRHGAPPVLLEVWAEPTRMTCRVTDRGPGIRDLMAGYRFPQPDEPMGLWTARQLCETVIVGNAPEGGCTVLLSTS